MGAKLSKESAVDPPDDAEKDVSTTISDSKGDEGDKIFGLVLKCKKGNTLQKSVTKNDVVCRISGDDSNHLTVQIGKVKYYNSRLPHPASSCRCDKIEFNVKGMDLIRLSITKSEPGFWVSNR